MLPQFDRRVGVERRQQAAVDELAEAVAGDRHDVGGGRRLLGGQQVELLALVVDEADLDLDAGVVLELLLEALGQEVGVGPDIDLRPRCAAARRR